MIDDFMLDIFHEFDSLASPYLNATMLCVKRDNLFRYIYLRLVTIIVRSPACVLGWVGGVASASRDALCGIDVC